MAATHSLITALPQMNGAESISDFDAFVIDLDALRNEPLSNEAFFRRQQELIELVHKKGGVVISFLRPNVPFSVTNVGSPSIYGLFEQMSYPMFSFLTSSVKSGTGSIVKQGPSAKGPSLAYFQVLRGNLMFTAFFQKNQADFEKQSGTVLAVNSVGYPIAAEFRIGEGLVAFLPVAHDVPGDRLGAALVNTVSRHFTKQTDIEIPAWASEITVPGANVHDERIAQLTNQSEQIAAEISKLDAKRNQLLNHVRLLFGYGKGVLESEVRVALRVIGFAIKEPEDYQGEWDIDLTETQTGRTALGEVEGSEGVIDVDKYRQLLDYIEAETAEGRDHKGILIGNGFRLLPLDAAERQRQFSDHAVRGAARNHFCLIPATELFKAVSAVLESPNDETLKIKIRDSILTTVGAWSFSR
jgi:hypothetical protein